MICQKCGNEFTERPAKSRIDNSPICSLCGHKEALDAAIKAGAMSQEVANGILEALKQNKKA